MTTGWKMQKWLRLTLYAPTSASAALCHRGISPQGRNLYHGGLTLTTWGTGGLFATNHPESAVDNLPTCSPMPWQRCAYAQSACEHRRNFKNESGNVLGDL